MKKNIFKIIAMLSLSIVTSCAHTFMRGTVATKIDSRTAIVCLGDNELNVGDKVRFEVSICNQSSVHGGMTNMQELDSIGRGDIIHTDPQICSLYTLGEGKVVKILNKHYSKVVLSSKFSFKEGVQVQIIK